MKFRADIRARSLFMEILKQPNRITRELRRMHRYGVLEEYLPVFGAVVGQMQYDLFHTYTVDEHSLFVVQNIRAFASPERPPVDAPLPGFIRAAAEASPALHRGALSRHRQRSAAAIIPSSE